MAHGMKEVLAVEHIAHFVVDRNKRSLGRNPKDQPNPKCKNPVSTNIRHGKLASTIIGSSPI